MELRVALGSALREGLRHRRLVAAAACFLLGAGVLFFGLGSRHPPSPVPDPAALTLDPAALTLDPAALTLPGAGGDAPAELVVYVTGAVPRPDVYRLPPGARVKDAVLAAGGLTPDAAAEQVNLAAPLSDAAHVHIPLAVPYTAVAPGPDAGAAHAAAGPALLDLNTASTAELEDLPGIGATLAARIVEHREAEGPFQSVETLREVRGVGEKLYAQIAPLVTVGP